MDYPGLVCDEVVEARRHGQNFFTIVETLKPEWLVLRPLEVKQMQMLGFTSFVSTYGHVQTFDVSSQLKSLTNIPLGYLKTDATYLIYHRFR
jgi:hypothetical protein